MHLSLNAQNAKLRGEAKDSHYIHKHTLLKTGPFGDIYDVLWLCDDHRATVTLWESGTIADAEAVERGKKLTRRWWRELTDVEADPGGRCIYPLPTNDCDRRGDASAEQNARRSGPGPSRAY